ncbi:hypothetical protein SAMN04489727_1787 [Amycolatopsis tolypomycina]|uniref:Peptidase inhibitor family I36 n=1 Tax=Amycolatopsis tolypomycina TaxID=208445 RepID=A0A1H4JDC6_9PSEU|nr:hypothetical protein [Amycolatopsis tolypomycina]SEB44283.1 hypothetical protein SAMN04489727_1787 [Amycolatopsis tolypomycina]
MKNLVKTFIVAGAAVGALAVPGVAMAAQGGTAAPSTGVGVADVNSKWCGHNYNSCVIERSQFARYYNVGPLEYFPYDPSCAGICYSGYRFYYWPK